jgi:hypothetical protein
VTFLPNNSKNGNDGKEEETQPELQSSGHLIFFEIKMSK